VVYGLSGLSCALSRISSFALSATPHELLPFPTRRSSDLAMASLAARSCGLEVSPEEILATNSGQFALFAALQATLNPGEHAILRSEEHTSELQSRENLVCRLLLEKKNRWPN